MRYLPTTLFALLLVLGGCDSSEDDPVDDNGGGGSAIAGTWEGEVDQSGFTYPAVMEIGALREGEVSGTMAYPSLNCSGTATYEGRRGAEYVFTEDITENAGGCLVRGQIRVEPQGGDRLAWAYYFLNAPDAAPAVFGTLTKR
jgi:hypothetical protein